MLNWVQGRRLFRQDLHVGQDERFQLPVRVFTEYAWHTLFARTMFVRDGSAADGAQLWTVIDLPGFKADPARHGVRSDTAVVLNFTDRTIVIANTEYSCGIQNSIFSAMNIEL